MKRSVSVHRRAFAGLLTSWAVAAGVSARAQSSSWPPAASSDVAREHFEREGATSFIVLRNGEALASHGDERRKVNLASVRKSLLGVLYGIAVEQGRIDLASTIGALAIDDTAPPLTEAEKQATIRDLLTARSGVYHAAAYETADIRTKRPPRGSHRHGTFWFYNNWDFSVLGTIYRRSVGDIFVDFERLIARPLGMEDFAASDGGYVREASSRHEAYPFRLSARDAGRFGQLMLDGGVWKGRRIVPADWISASLTAHSQTDRGNLGYGYLWWVLPPQVFGAGAGFAAGYGGQFIAIVPSRQLVVVQTVARCPDGGGGGTRRFVRTLSRLAEAV